VIVVGYARPLSKVTLDTLSLFPHQLKDVSGSDDAYFDLLQAWWASSEEDLIILEHDIEPTPEFVQEILDCHRLWCAAMYTFEDRYLYGLGLTKFNRRVRAAVPDLFEQIALLSDGHHPSKHWCRLDAHMQNTLSMQSGEAAHLHEGAIVHTNPIRSHVACRPLL
jgi:hypothetical protein